MKPIINMLQHLKPYVVLHIKLNVLKNSVWLFEDIVKNISHKLSKILPSGNTSTANLRNRRLFQLPVYKTNRFKTFLFLITYMIVLLLIILGRHCNII